MKSSPKADETPPSTGSKTPASGRKLVQARLPFKSLGGSEPPFIASNDDTIAASPNGTTPVNENRKRKQTATLTQEDGVRAAKINRLSKDINNDAVESNETTNTNKNKNLESKENVCFDNDEKNDAICLDTDDETVDDDAKNSVNTPKAKQSLSFSESKTEARKSKRISDANSIQIKLPLTKKEKETAKKAKKQKKTQNNENEIELNSDDKINTDEPSTCTEKQNEKNESATSDDKDENDDTIDLNQSALDSSMISDISLDGPSTPSSKLTPKQLQRRADSEKKALERQRAKVEKERKAQEEKELKRKEREEKEEQKRKEREEKEEQKRKEREEKEEMKRKEREERERKIQEEKEQKQREKEERERKIQEEKEQKIREKEEKRKEREEKERKMQEEREEKLRKKEEAMEAEQSKIRKTSEAFVKFFVPKKSDGKSFDDPNEEKTQLDKEQQQHFMSFQVKEGMKMAPIKRRALNDDERSNLENIVSKELVSEAELYLSELKSNKIIPRKSGRTLQDDEDEKCSNDEDIFVIDETGEGVQVIEEKPKKFYRAKFFKFTENRRPPYYGTWRKRSTVLKPRKPFAQDATFFNYEIDSDDEWEEEEPGESLHGSDDEKDQESEDDYDIDNEFFVPHGHLSDEELQNEDEFDYENSEDHKMKMQLIQKQFDREMKKKTQKLKPRVIGLIWQNADGSRPDHCSEGVWNLLNNNSVYTIGDSVKIEPPTSVNEPLSDDENSTGKRRLQISEKEIPDLIRLINGNTYKIDFLTEEFRAYVAKNNPGRREYTTASIKSKIRELAFHQRCPEEGPMLNKKCWYVPIDTRKRYNLNDLTFPNQWTYIIPPRRPIQSNEIENESKIKIEQKKSNSQDVIDLNEDSNNSCGLSETLTPDTVKQAAMKPSSYNIAKFIRVLSEEEKKKQFDPIRIQGPTIDLTAEPSSSTQSNKNRKTVKKRNSVSTTVTSNTNNTSDVAPQKKRVSLLMSVARGEDFSPKTKNTLVTQFLNKNTKKRQSTDDNSSSTKTAGTSDGSKKMKKSDTVIVID